MPQVYADKNGSNLGKKPDPNMRIKTRVGDGSLVHMRIKIIRPGSNQDLQLKFTTTDAKPPEPFKHLYHCRVVSNNFSECPTLVGFILCMFRFCFFREHITLPTKWANQILKTLLLIPLTPKNGYYIETWYIRV